MKVIVGLGNPGKQYENTRHNVGFMVIDALAKELGLGWENNKKFKADLAKNSDYVLIKPVDFMNNSGFSVAAALAYFKLLPKKLGILKVAKADLSDVLTVVHDDLDIKFGKYKISVDSRSAGHKGIESIIVRLKTKNFQRLRVGIRIPAVEKIPADKFVMQKFNDEEKMIIQGLTEKIIKEIK